jgi:hypothetical protein
MNAKKAKALRRLLKSAVEAKIQKGDDVKEIAYVEVEKNRKYALLPTNEGKPQHIQVAPGTILASNDSIRGVYLALKRGLEKGEHVQKNL